MRTASSVLQSGLSRLFLLAYPDPSPYPFPGTKREWTIAGGRGRTLPIMAGGVEEYHTINKGEELKEKEKSYCF